MPKLTRVIMGVDFCPPSAEAARWTALHFAPEAEIFLVHAIDLPQPPAFLRGRFPPHEDLVLTQRVGAEARFKELGPWFRSERIETEVAAGRAAEALLVASDLHGADLVAVGVPGCRRGAWRWLGTTAEQLVRSATVPVLLVRHPADRPPSGILVPFDGSRTAESSLRWAGFLAERFDASVFVLYVIDPSVHALVPEVVPPLRSRHLGEQAKRDAKSWLETEIGEAGLDPGAVEPMVVFGDPACEIIAAIARLGVDLVVMGGRGAGAAKSFLLGAVGHSILDGAPCSVFVVDGLDG